MWPVQTAYLIIIFYLALKLVEMFFLSVFPVEVVY